MISVQYRRKQAEKPPPITSDAVSGHGRRTWIAVHGGKVVLVVLGWGQLPGADRGVERVGVGDKVGVSQVGRQVVRGGECR